MSNVLVSAWTLDVLLTMADEGLLKPFWSSEILDEFGRAMGRLGRPDAAEHIAAAINSAYPDALVTDWEHLVPSINLPDKDDRHVAAAAVASDCDLIVTYNLKDFPPAEMEGLGVSVYHPDEMMMLVVEEEPEAVGQAMGRLIEDNRRPPRTVTMEA